MDAVRSRASRVSAPTGPGTVDVLPDAFQQRRALMPLWGARAVPREEWAERWAAMLATPLPESMLAYVHVPFCENHCVFCGFYRNAWKESQGAPYTDRVIAELESEAARRPPGGGIGALYFGGGTPSALATADLVRLIRAARRHLPLAADCEITLEGRIAHFDRDKAEACLEAGVNRISIGVQTFDGPLRRRLGRQKDGEAAAAYLADLARNTDAVIVADLIFGLPGQDDAVWARDLDVALSLGLSGIDLYAFNNYPGLPLNRMIEKGALPGLPGLGGQARHYAQAARRLLDAGWTQLSNSHFGNGRPGGGERNRYNLAIKSGGDCLAFGSGAGGTHAGHSYQVSDTLAGYLATPAADKPIGHLAAVSPLKAFAGRIQGQLETGEVDPELLAPYPACLDRLAAWRELGLLDWADGRARLSLAGRFWAPAMARELILLIPPSEETP